MLKKAYMVPHPPLIVPEVGRGQERAIQDTIDSYKKIARDIIKQNPDTIIISTPHSIMYQDYFHISPGLGAYGDFSQFGVPQVNAKAYYDSEFAEHLERLAGENQIPAGTLGERDPSLDHATLIPLYFLNQEDPGFLDRVKIVRLGLSGLPLEEHYKLGELIDQTAKDLDRDIVYIASGDLSHVLKADGPYGFKKEGPEFDEKFVSIVKDGDLTKFKELDEDFLHKAAECGLRSFVIMSGALDDYDYKTNLLSYEGPFGVGYGCAEVDITGEKK